MGTAQPLSIRSLAESISGIHFMVWSPTKTKHIRTAKPRRTGKAERAHHYTSNPYRLNTTHPPLNSNNAAIRLAPDLEKKRERYYHPTAINPDISRDLNE